MRIFAVSKQMDKGLVPGFGSLSESFEKVGLELPFQVHF